MATTLFITRKQLVQNTILDGNVDTDKFIHFIKIAQEIHIRNFLGTDLYNAIVTKINAGNLTGAYLTLTTTYVQPMLIHYAMADYLPFAAYQIKNGGVFKHTSENAESVSKNEIDYLNALQTQTIIIDHHEIIKPYPKATVFINPKKNYDNKFLNDGSRRDRYTNK